MKYALQSLLIALALTATQASAAVTYFQDFNGFATGTGNPDGWWSYQGPNSVTATLDAQPSGTGGSLALEMNVDSSGAFGTDWYFYAGVGRSDLIAAGILPGNVTISLDMALFGANSGTAVTLAFNQYSGQTKVWEVTFNPTLTTDGTFTQVNLNFAQATQTGAWNPALPIGLNSMTFDGNGFGLDAGNRVIVDNIQVNVIPEPSALSLLGLAGAFMLRRFLRRGSRLLPLGRRDAGELRFNDR